MIPTRRFFGPLRYLRRSKKRKRQAAVLQKALDEAKKANLLKTDFISNVSHDMRTPLNGVIGYTDMALESNDIARSKKI
jgi:signal transduction histidine kinase